MTFFGSEIGSEFEEPGGTPPPRIPRITPSGFSSSRFRVVNNAKKKAAVYIIGLHGNRQEKYSACFFIGYVVFLNTYFCFVYSI